MAKPACYGRSKKRVSFSEMEIDAARQLLQLSEEDSSACNSTNVIHKPDHHTFDASEVSSEDMKKKKRDISKVVDDDNDEDEDEPLRRRKMKFRSIDQIYSIATKA